MKLELPNSETSTVLTALIGTSGSGSNSVLIGNYIIMLVLIAITLSGSATVRAVGCGGGSFTQAAGSPISVPGNNPRLVVSADFNLDGKPDLAVATTSSTEGSVYLGNGVGGFGPAKPFKSIGDEFQVGDFNGDGKPDLATLSRSNSGDNKITILLGDGGGNFNLAPGSPFAPPSAADFMAAGDFNRDGKLDLAFIASAGSSSVRILLGNGSGGFTPSGAPIPTGSFSRDIVAADFNLDGKLDLVISNQGSNNLTVLLGDGAGGFSSSAASPVGSQATTPLPDAIKIGDFNLDGKPDLAVASGSSFRITILLGNGTGGFTAAAGSPKSVIDPMALTIADFDLDGLPDLGVANSSGGVMILSGDGKGRVNQLAAAVPVGSGTVSLAAADFNLDGRPDFGTANFSSKDVSIELNNCTSGGLLQFSQPSYTVQEDLGTVTLTVNRTGDTSAAATVIFNTFDGTATQKGDYEIGAGTITFAPGETSKTVQVLINEDSFPEGNESFGVFLSNPIGAGIGPQGATSVTIVDDAVESGANPIDDAQSFVYVHYHDFLSREPDAAGLQFWTSQITACGGDQACIDRKRADVSAAFYLSIEFQNTGYLVYRTYKAAYGNLPGAPVPLRFSEFIADTHEVGLGLVVNQPGWDQVLEGNKQLFMTDFVQRARFTATYPGTMTTAQFVDALTANAGLTPTQSDRQAAINEFSGNPMSADTTARAHALRDVAENSTLAQQEFNRAFVLMQYFGYLRRDPNATPEPGLNFNGYNFWLNKLNQFNGNYNDADMVRAFIVSAEYRQRFGF